MYFYYGYRICVCPSGVVVCYYNFIPYVCAILNRCRQTSSTKVAGKRPDALYVSQ